MFILFLKVDCVVIELYHVVVGCKCSSCCYWLLVLVANVHHVIVGVNHIATNVHCVHLFNQISPLFFIVILLVFIVLLLVVGFHCVVFPFCACYSPSFTLSFKLKFCWK
jgi:succinate dehydrogenase/fumarate reductase cytochrome b subunit